MDPPQATVANEALRAARTSTRKSCEPGDLPSRSMVPFAEIRKAEVAGSSPTSGSISKSRRWRKLALNRPHVARLLSSTGFGYVSKTQAKEDSAVRRKTISVPSMRPLKAKGRMRVTLGGRTFYLGKEGDPECEKAYEALVAVWLAKGRPSRWEETGVEVRSALTLDDLILEYSEFIEVYYVKNGKPTAEQSKIRAALRFVRALGGTKPADAFGPLLLEQARDAMIEAGHCRRHVNQSVQRIRRCFRWGVAKQLVAPATLQGLEALPGLRRGRSKARETEPVRPAPAEAIEAVLPLVSRQVAAMIRLQLLTGMRPGEVCLMRGCDLDRSGDVWVYTPATHKTEHHGRVRQVLIGPRGQEVLRPFLATTSYLFRADEAAVEARAKRKKPGRRPKKRKASPKRSPRPHYDRFSYARAVVRACETAGVERWSPNQLRHAAATHLRQEAGIEMARVVLGHSSAVTSEIYAERDLAGAAKVLGRIG